MTLRLYLIAADTPEPLKLALASKGVAVNAAIETIPMEQGMEMTGAQLQDVLDELIGIAAPDWRPPAVELEPFEAPVAAPAPDEQDPDSWRSGLDSDLPF